MGPHGAHSGHHNGHHNGRYNGHRNGQACGTMLQTSIFCRQRCARCSQPNIVWPVPKATLLRPNDDRSLLKILAFDLLEKPPKMRSPKTNMKGNTVQTKQESSNGKNVKGFQRSRPSVEPPVVIKSRTSIKSGKPGSLSAPTRKQE